MMPNKRVSHEETALTDIFAAIQLERGSSCVCVASIGKQPQFQARMLMARETVDHLREQVGAGGQAQLKVKVKVGFKRTVAISIKLVEDPRG